MPTVTTTDAGPLAIDGTVTRMDVSVHAPEIVAAVPLKVTVLAPWEAPRFVPWTVTVDPGNAEFGDTPVTLGGGITVKLNPLLD